MPASGIGRWVLRTVCWEINPQTQHPPFSAGSQRLRFNIENVGEDQATTTPCLAPVLEITSHHLFTKNTLRIWPPHKSRLTRHTGSFPRIIALPRASALEVE